MDRGISPNEVKVVKWLLDHALVDVTAYRLQPVEQLRVVGGCICGCTTLHFKPLGQQKGEKILADELAVYADGQQAGLIPVGTRRRDRDARGVRFSAGVVTSLSRCVQLVYLG